MRALTRPLRCALARLAPQAAGGPSSAADSMARLRSIVSAASAQLRSVKLVDAAARAERARAALLAEREQAEAGLREHRTNLRRSTLLV